MPEMHLIQPGLTYSACESFAKTKKEQKHLKKQGHQDVFIKTNQIKTAFSMI